MLSLSCVAVLCIIDFGGKRQVGNCVVRVYNCIPQVVFFIHFSCGYGDIGGGY